MTKEMIKMDESVLNDFFGSRLQQNVPLANLTTAKAGGAARYFVTSSSAGQLAEDIRFLWSVEAPFFILGSGSNILVTSRYHEGVFIRLRGSVHDFRTEPASPGDPEGIEIQATIQRHLHAQPETPDEPDRKEESPRKFPWE